MDVIGSGFTYMENGSQLLNYPFDGDGKTPTPLYEILPLQQLLVGKNNFSRLNFCIYGISISHPITLGSKTPTHTHTSFRLA